MLDEYECPAKVRLATHYAESFDFAMEAVRVLPSKVGQPGFNRYVASTDKLLKRCARARKALRDHIRLHKC